MNNVRRTCIQFYYEIRFKTIHENLISTRYCFELVRIRRKELFIEAYFKHKIFLFFLFLIVVVVARNETKRKNRGTLQIKLKIISYLQSFN